MASASAAACGSTWRRATSWDRVGQYGWSGAATTNFTIDPKEELLILVMAQHFPFNQHDLFWQFSTLVYASLVD